MGRQSKVRAARVGTALRESVASLASARPLVARLLLVSLGGVLASTCRSPTAVYPPDGAVPFTPPAVYASWWSMVEQCAGRRGNFQAVQWFLMPGAHSFDLGDMRVAGVWTRAGNAITVGEHARLNGQLVRHEMLHAILQGGSHPRAQYLGHCAGVVTCGENCIREAGPADPPGATVPRVLPTALNVKFDIAPGTPSASKDDGWFTLTVEAKNGRSTPVVIELPQAVAGSSRGFAFDLVGPLVAYRRSVRVIDDGVTYFPPGASKRYVFDFQLAGQDNPAGLVPGTYSIRAAFGDHWSGWGTITVGP